MCKCWWKLSVLKGYLNLTKFKSCTIIKGVLGIDHELIFIYVWSVQIDQSRHGDLWQTNASGVANASTVAVPPARVQEAGSQLSPVGASAGEV